MSLSDNEISDSFTPALTQCNDELTTILNNDKIDHTGFAYIDPDTNYLKSWRSENHTPIIIGLTKVNRHTSQ